MRQYIQAVIKPPYLDWELYLPALRIAYNTSVSKATKKSPFSLLFAMEPQMPFFDFEPELSYSENYYDRLAALEKARAEAVENNLLYKEMYAAQYNARHNVQEPSLSVGDLILVEARPDQQHRNAKFHNLYDGPFVIVRISSPNVYYQKGKKIQVTHINRIKRVRSPISVDQRENVTRVTQPSTLPPGEIESRSAHPMTTRSKGRAGSEKRLGPPQALVYHNMEAPVEDDDIGLRNSQSDEVQLYQSVPEGVHSLDENMLLVDNSEALEVTEQGEV